MHKIDGIRLKLLRKKIARVIKLEDWYFILIFLLKYAEKMLSMCLRAFFEAV